MENQQAEIITISLSPMSYLYFLFYSYILTRSSNMHITSSVLWTSSFISGIKKSQTLKKKENKKGPCGLEALDVSMKVSICCVALCFWEGFFITCTQARAGSLLP